MEKIPGMTQEELMHEIDLSFDDDEKFDSALFHQSQEYIDLMDQTRPTFSVKFGAGGSDLDIIGHQS